VEPLIADNVSLKFSGVYLRMVSLEYNFADVINFYDFGDLAIRLLTATGPGEAREPSYGSAR
jgi:hypothetical protein